ncbi:MAG: hypothetical protein V9H69_19775 [Anaerolineae bacterium]
MVRALVRRLQQFEHPVRAAGVGYGSGHQTYTSQGYRVVIGDLDSPETYRRLRAENALLVATTADDRVNTNVACYRARGRPRPCPSSPRPTRPASVDILQLAGCNSRACRWPRCWASRWRGAPWAARRWPTIIGQIDETPSWPRRWLRARSLVDQTIAADAGCASSVGINVLGTWERGQFHASQPDTLIHDDTVLVLAGNSVSDPALQRAASISRKPPAGRC